MQFGSMLVYCTVYDMCVCGGPTSIFFQGAPNPLAMALGPGNTFKAFLGSARVRVPLSNKIRVRDFWTREDL